MKQAILDGRLLTTRSQIHQALARQLEFPAWYGANLDALHDCLTSSREEIRLVLAHPELLEKNFGSWLNALRRMLRRRTEERGAPFPRHKLQHAGNRRTGYRSPHGTGSL